MTNLNQNGSNNPNFRHGLRGSKIYESWADMKKRCNNKNSKYYCNYGGRGISYDPKWEKFQGFLEQMGAEYFEGATLERINVDDDYCKGNCCWILKEAQSRNTRKRKDNSTGKVGVHLGRTNGVLTHYVASAKSPSGGRTTKWFSIEKYGESEAFKMASIFRDSLIDKLENLGESYGKYHKD